MGAIAQPAVEISFFSPADHLYGESVRPRVPGARLVSLQSKNHILLAHEPAWAKFLDEVGEFVRPKG